MLCVPLWAGCGPEGMSALVVTSIDRSQHTNVEKFDFIRRLSVGVCAGLGSPKIPNHSQKSIDKDRKSGVHIEIIEPND